MPTTMPDRAATCQANPPDRDIDARATALDLLSVIRRAIAEAGWNQEALAAAMGKDAAYISRVLSGEKPLSVGFLLALPDDIEALVARAYAESFGHVVVTPASDDSAVQHFVGGLLTLLRPQLPAKASRMAHAAIAPAAQRRGPR